MTFSRKKRSGKSRRREQEPTQPISIRTVMRNPCFAAGAADARAGLPFRADYDRWDVNDQFDYERGRAWALLTPRDVPLKRNGKLNERAVLWFSIAIKGIL
jgi:hypothetical protein